MIELSMFMWLLTVFFSVLGFLRGWQKELVASAGVILVTFALFQFDAFLRTIFFAFNAEQLFLAQFIAFIVIVFLVYQAPQIGGGGRRENDDIQEGLIGGIAGALNGYLVGGSIWYFLDINQYPFSEYVTAPAFGSPSDDAIGLMPMMLLGGGGDGTGTALSVGVLFLVVIVLVTI